MSYHVDPLMPNRASSDIEHIVSFVSFPKTIWKSFMLPRLAQFSP